MSVSAHDGVSFTLVQPTIFRGTVQPEGAVGDLWVDTNFDPPVEKVCKTAPSTWVTISGGGGGGTWGSITGTLSDQTDLQTALNLKADTSSLATVATTGAYSDLSGTPTIPAQFNPIAGTDLAISGTYPDQTFSVGTTAPITSQLVFNTDYSDLGLKTWTPVGSPSINTTIYKFGGGSLLLNGSTDWLLTTPSPDFDLGTDDFTIEFHAYKTADNIDGYDTVFATDSSGSGYDGYFVELSSIRGFGFCGTGGTLVNYVVDPNDSTWHHYAVSRTGTTLKLFIDGTEVYSGTNSDNNTFVYSPTIGTFAGGTGSYPFYGYLDNIRITKGIGRYTAGFTPPVAEYPLPTTTTLSSLNTTVSALSTSLQERVSLTAVASEALSAGNFVQVWNNSGSLNVRKADGSTTGKEANGFVVSAFSSSDVATVYFVGVNDQLSGLTVGSRYYLDGTTAGAITATPVTTSGKTHQFVGKALSATSLAYVYTEPISLA